MTNQTVPDSDTLPYAVDGSVPTDDAYLSVSADETATAAASPSADR